MSKAKHTPRILILGGGFGGAYCAQKLRRRLRSREAEILLIDRRNYFVFYPLLVEAGTGSLEPRHAVVSIRAFLKDTAFRMAEVTDIDPTNGCVRYRLFGADRVDSVKFDFLMLALGSQTNLPDVPGLRELGFEMKSLADAVALRDRAIQMLELADATDDEDQRSAMLHFVVVGANFTGVEIAGEFEVFLRNACRHYGNVGPRDVSVTLVELTDRVLRALDPDLSNYAADQLNRREINIRLNESVAAIEPDLVRLRSGQTIRSRTVIWCAGIAPPRIIADLPFAKDARGYILTNRDLRVPGFENIWTIGDCAVNPGPDGVAYPATAQHAVKQAQHVAQDIARVLRGRATRPCNIASTGSLAALGCRTGVAKVFGIKLSGFLAWWLWRTVYLLKMPGLGRKIRVALDWALDLVFERDYVQLSVHRRSPVRAHDTYRGDCLPSRRTLHEDRKMTTPDNDTEHEELNRRTQALNERLSGAAPDERNEILKEIDEIARQIREMDLDDRLRGSMEGGSEG